MRARHIVGFLLAPAVAAASVTRCADEDITRPGEPPPGWVAPGPPLLGLDPTPLVPDPVSYWPGEGNYLDMANGTNNGTPAGDVTFAPGIKGQAFSFPSGRSGEIVLTHTAEHELADGNASMTAAAWVKADLPFNEPFAEILIFNYACTPPAIQLLATSATGSAPINFQFAVRDNSDIAYGAQELTIPDPEEWHFLVGVRDGPANQIRLYRDGALVASNTDPTTSIRPVSGGNTDRIGAVAVPCATKLYWRGLIDEVKVWNVALTAEQIKREYDAVVNPTPVDNTAPVITETVTGTLGASGWFTSDVTVAWGVSDPESQIQTQTGCSATTLTTDTPGQSFTCEATSAGGTASKTVTIKRDATAPSVSSFSVRPRFLSSGGSITIELSASDGGSGIVLVACRVQGPGGLDLLLPMTPVAPGQWELILPPELILPGGPGDYTITPVVGDAAGNQPVVPGGTSTFDPLPPEIGGTNTTTPGTFLGAPVLRPGECVETEGSGVRDPGSGLISVEALITQPDGSVVTVPLSPAGGDRYSGEICYEDLSGGPGLYQVRIGARDGAGNRTVVRCRDFHVSAPVPINIKPGSNPNSVNMKGQVPVAILSTASFDATRVDALSVRFGPRAVLAAGGGGTEIHGRGHIEDAPGLDDKTRDGVLDMVLHFDPAASGLTPAVTEACVWGVTRDGIRFEGCDAVRVVK